VQLNKQTDRRVDQTRDECAYIDVQLQADGGTAACLAAPPPIDDEYHAGDSNDGRYVMARSIPSLGTLDLDILIIDRLTSIASCKVNILTRPETTSSHVKIL